MTNEEKLDSAAYDLADKYRADAFLELKDKSWEEAWSSLIERLKRQCPGFTKGEYDAALNKGFQDSR